MSSSLIGSLLKLELRLQCDLCHNLVNNTRTLNECGHRFCRGCVYDRVGVERTCPTCHLPAIVKNLRPDPMHDTLVACVRKLGTLLVGGTPSVDTHGLLSASNSVEQSLGNPMNRQESSSGSLLLQMARGTSNNNNDTTRSSESMGIDQRDKVLSDTTEEEDVDRTSPSNTETHDIFSITRQPVQELSRILNEAGEQAIPEEKHVSTSHTTATAAVESMEISRKASSSLMDERTRIEKEIDDLSVRNHDYENFFSSVLSISAPNTAILPSWRLDQLRNSVPFNADDEEEGDDEPRPSLNSETTALLRRTDNRNLSRLHRSENTSGSVTRTPSPLQVDDGDLFPISNNDDTFSCNEQATCESSVATVPQTPSLLRDFLEGSFDNDDDNNEGDAIMQEQAKEDHPPNNVQNTTNTTAKDHDYISNELQTPPTIPSSSKHDEHHHHRHSHNVNNNDIINITTTTTTQSQHNIIHCNNYTDIQHPHDQQQQQQQSAVPATTTAVDVHDNDAEIDDNELYSSQALFNMLDQSSLPDDELSSPEDERPPLPPPSKQTITPVPVAIKPSTQEDEEVDVSGDSLLQVLMDDGLPDDEIPVVRDKAKAKQLEKEELRPRSSDTHGNVRRYDTIDHDNNKKDTSFHRHRQKVPSTTTASSDFGGKYDYNTNISQDSNFADGDSIAKQKKRKSIDRSTDNNKKTPIASASLVAAAEAVAPEASAEVDIFSFDVPHPSTKRLRLSNTNDNNNSGNSVASNDELVESAATPTTDTATDQQEEQESWRCLHCYYMNLITVETCSLCRKLRGTAPAVAITPSIPRTPMTVTGSVIPTSQEEQDYLAASSMTTVDAVRVMFTGIKTDEAQAVLDKFGESELTISPVNDDVDDIPRHVDDVTHIVTKGNEQGLSCRTVKYLWGILAGKWIVDVTWLIDSCNEGRWLPEETYEISGDTVAGVTHGPRKGRRRLENQEAPLFNDMRFNFFDKAHPNRDKLMKLCQQVGGGEVLSRRPPAGKSGASRDNNDNVQRRSVDRNIPIIIVTDQKQLKKKSAKPLELYQVRDARWLLDCISRCDIEETNN